MIEPAGLKQRADDHVAEREKRDRGRDDEEGDAAQAGVESQANLLRSTPDRRRRSRDMAGSSAADTDMPNRLTGRV